MPLQRILPENILVKNHDSDNPEVRIIVAGLTIGDLNQTLVENFFALDMNDLKYFTPEFFESKKRSDTSNFWCVGIMM